MFERLFGKNQRAQKEQSVKDNPISCPDTDRIRRLIPLLERIVEDLKNGDLNTQKAFGIIKGMKVAIHPPEAAQFTMDYFPNSQKELIEQIRITIGQMRSGLPNDDKKDV